MRITKCGHSCLLIEEGAFKALMDPGNYSPTSYTEGVDVILITHEHDDHCYLPAIQEVLKKNPQAEIITHEAVGRKLETVGIKWTPIKDGEQTERKGVAIASYGAKHARIHPDLPIFDNTGFLIAGRLFYPGDALYQPPVAIEILALPVSAPWMRVEECICVGWQINVKYHEDSHDHTPLDRAWTRACLTFVPRGRRVRYRITPQRAWSMRGIPLVTSRGRRVGRHVTPRGGYGWSNPCRR